MMHGPINIRNSTNAEQGVGPDITSLFSSSLCPDHHQISSQIIHKCPSSQTFQCIMDLLTAWCRVLLEKLTGLQVVKKLAAFHGTRRFITALISVRHLSLSWESPIHSIYPHPSSWRSTLILSTHLRLGLPSGFLPSGFPKKTLYTPLSSHICTTCLAHLILLDFITRTIMGEEYRSLCLLLHSPVTSSLLGPNILHNTVLTFLLFDTSVLRSLVHLHKTRRHITQRES